jgi:SAM-dependent methyltransferase
VDGFTSSSYGDAFADVYDEWYEDLDDVPAVVAALARLAGDGGRVLELGVGTGRLAVPLATLLTKRDGSVTGIDASAAMLERLTANDPGGLITASCGDMVDALPDGPFDVVLVAYNTLFNLLDGARQAACVAAAAARLAAGGVLVIEAFVPDDQARSTRDDVGVRTLRADEVVLSVSRTSPDDQRVEGQYVSISEAGGVRLRPWSIRWSTPAQIDAMAAAAGLVRIARWGSLAGETFDEHSARHVSVYADSGATEEASARVRKVLG